MKGLDILLTHVIYVWCNIHKRMEMLMNCNEFILMKAKALKE